MKTPYDKIGREIKVGDFIAYGHALGRCAALAIGKVLDIKYGPPKSAYSSTRNQWSISVWGVDDGWDGKKKLNSTKGTLQFPDRIIVLDKVPDEYEKLLGHLTAESKATRVMKDGWSQMIPPQSSEQEKK
jgi:hypothetical protein